MTAVIASSATAMSAAASKAPSVDFIFDFLRRVGEVVRSCWEFLSGVGGWVFSHALLLGTLGVVGVGLWLLARFLLTRHMLRDRTVVFASAVDDWDPSAEELARFVSVLDQERPRGLTARARGRRIRLDSAPSGKVMFGYELPADVVRSLRASVPSQIALRDPDSIGITVSNIEDELAQEKEVDCG